VKRFRLIHGSRYEASEAGAANSGAGAIADGKWSEPHMDSITAHSLASGDAGGEILVSGTVDDLANASEIAFAERGEHQLERLPAVWKLFVVSARSQCPEDDERSVEAPRHMRSQIS
jgi:hypothetical protein